MFYNPNLTPKIESQIIYSKYQPFSLKNQSNSQKSLPPFKQKSFYKTLIITN